MKSNTKCLIIVFFVIGIVLIGISCQNSTKKLERTDETNLDKIFGITISNLKRVPFDDKLAKAAETYFEVEKVNPKMITIYEGSATINEKTRALRFIIHTLEKGDLNGAKLGVSIFENGTIYKTRIWGNDYVDLDTDGSVENFYRQFDNKRNLKGLKTIASEIQAKEYIESLSEAQKYRYRHVILMLNNNFLIRSSMALTQRDKFPDTAWYRSYHGSFDELKNNVEMLNLWLDDSDIAAYVEEIGKSKKGLDELITLTQEETSPRKLRNQVKSFRKKACMQCHNIPSSRYSKDKDSPSIYTLLKDRFHIEKELRQDLFVVSFDVWSIPDKPELSQYLANQIKVSLLLERQL